MYFHFLRLFKFLVIFSHQKINYKSQAKAQANSNAHGKPKQLTKHPPNQQFTSPAKIRTLISKQRTIHQN